MFSKLAAARQYAARGVRVFPAESIKDGRCTCAKADCGSPGKHPKIKGWQEAATTNSEQIDRWWGQWPDANIAIPTGSANNLVVLDLDGPEAVAALQELEAKHGPLPPTATAKTSRGEHRYHRLEHGQIVKTSKPFAMADLKAEGGYVIAPPSNHVSGAVYAWDCSLLDNEAAPLPGWLCEPSQCKKAGRSQAMRVDVAFDELVSNLRLETALGEAQGNRHNRAVKLVGSAVARGMPPHRIAALLLKWARTCDPPYDTADETEELLEIIEWATEKEVRNLEAARIGDAPPWPTLEPIAFHGLAGEIVRAIEPETESDSAALLLQFLVAFGCVVGRGPHTMVEATEHHLNLFLVLVGLSSKGRKGTSWGWIQKLFEAAAGVFPLPREINGLSSGEGLINAVRDANPTQLATRSGRQFGQPETQPDFGVSDKRLLVVEGEFSGLLCVMRREGNSLSAIIRSAWDGGALNLVVKNNPLRATKPHISIIGHITLEELRSRWPEVEAFNGFANRFLWGCVKRSKLLPEGGRQLNLAVLQARLGDRINFADSVGRMERDTEARLLWADLYSAMSRSPGGLFGSVTARGEPQVLRIAMIYALLDGTCVIRREHLEAGYAIWKYCEASARYIFGDSTGNATADMLLKAIRERPHTTTELHGLFGRHKPAKELKSALQRLVELRLIRCEKLSSGGRPIDMWFAM